MGIAQRGDNDPPEVYYTIKFEHDGTNYTGRITPQYKKSKDEPSSWHVILNDVLFGYLHKDSGHWEVSEQRPQGLVNKLGQQIDNQAWQIHMI